MDGIGSQHSDDKNNTSSDRGTNYSASRNQNNTSRLSNNTRMVNKIAANQKRMDQKKNGEESDRKVT